MNSRFCPGDNKFCNNLQLKRRNIHDIWTRDNSQFHVKHISCLTYRFGTTCKTAQNRMCLLKEEQFRKFQATYLKACLNLLSGDSHVYSRYSKGTGNLSISAEDSLLPNTRGKAVGWRYWFHRLVVSFVGLAILTVSVGWVSLLPARACIEPWFKRTLKGSKADAVALSFCSEPSFAPGEVKGSLFSYFSFGMQSPVELAGDVSPKPDE